MKAAITSLALRSRSSRRLAALMCLGLFCLLQVFAASGELHHILHADSAAPEHHCVITLVSQGQVSPPDVIAGCVLVVLGFLFAWSLVRTVPVSSFDYQFAPSRGPPQA